MAITNIVSETASYPTTGSFPAQSSHHCAPRVPPSPPMDSSEPRFSLPPISDLLGLAGAGSPTVDSSASWQDSPRPRRSSFPATRPQTTQYSPVSTRTSLPPTPPVGSEGLCDHSCSPLSHSGSHFGAASAGYRYESTPPLEDPFNRSVMAQRASHPAAYGASASGIYYQRPLPTAFPPMIAPPNTWHGHYMTPAPTFQQSQDRYICPTCNKAFSRPSSLRIHNYSHTGEKPFKCSVNGCGKAFSVRSNMKRHERGCHTDGMPGGSFSTSTFARSP